MSIGSLQYTIPFWTSISVANHTAPTCIEICAGAGGQAIGLERAGFRHLALVEIEKEYCRTLQTNRPDWNVINEDVKAYQADRIEDLDLFAGGVPCPPFSFAGKQLGHKDERDLFPEAIRLIAALLPRAIMLENVRGLFAPRFKEYRQHIQSSIESLGYRIYWQLLNASDYGVPQLRPRTILVGIRNDINTTFHFPKQQEKRCSVGEALFDLISENGWPQAYQWKEQAINVAPTIVGGSKKHGGPDLGPTRAKKAWASLGIDGSGIGNNAPDADFEGMPRLTNRMVARLQGFPDDWTFAGTKTNVYRQIGNAFPPPVAEAIGKEILKCIKKRG
ncbi:MAG: DNA cytosine methyltransferase [Mediterranea sp.]|jgi:DNA (cytosine-5)-methyltransferase 1|nr:DNA cytosine methyltransferase [Mediterranea sp.]